MFYQFAICQKKVFRGLCNISEKSVSPIHAICQKSVLSFYAICHKKSEKKSVLSVYAICQKKFFFSLCNMWEKRLLSFIISLNAICPKKKCSISLCNLSEKSFSSVYAICQKKVFYQFMQWICQKKVFYQFMQYFRKCVLSNYAIWKKSVPSLSDYAICPKKKVLSALSVYAICGVWPDITNSH
jgi:hypothetical protein